MSALTYAEATSKDPEEACNSQFQHAFPRCDLPSLRHLHSNYFKNNITNFRALGKE